MILLFLCLEGLLSFQASKRKFLHAGSSVWPHLWATYTEIIHNCKWKVKFLYDNWDGPPLIDLVPYSSSLIHPSALVSYFLNKNDTWKFNDHFKVIFFSNCY